MLASATETLKPCCPVPHVAQSAGVAGEFSRLFDTSDFPPRWHCGTWSSVHGWTHIISDLMIWSAYLAIPIALIYFIKRRKDMPFGPLFWLFGTFIIACGTTHLMEAIIFWWPGYRLAAVIKLATGLISWTTVCCLLPVIPKALKLKTPDQLEKEVQQRTRMLQETTGQLETSNRELAQAKESAEIATIAKSAFLANMSHEIRTPLTAILGFAEELRQQDLTADDRQNAAETIERNGRHLLCVINDILDVAKIEAGKLTIEQIAFNLKPTFEDTVALYRPIARDKKIELSLESSGEMPESVVTDPTRLRQIIANLLSNALKFTNQGSIRIRMGVAQHSTGQRLRFEVADTGIGMSPTQLRKVFDPFTQADTTTTRKFGGSGLGLTICKELANLLGGSIGIESREGAGTNVCVEIPVVVPNETTSIKHYSNTNHVEEIRLDGISILLAEDGTDNQRLFSTILKRYGADLVVVGDGRKAIDEVTQAVDSGAPFDVILMDVQMPEMDGLAATKILRSKGYKTPIIALTALAMAGDRERCIAAGCNSFVSKPINRTQLLRAVHDAVQKKQLATGAGASTASS